MRFGSGGQQINMKFIDLFAGLGGFHVALHELGHECVFASEIDENLRALYTQNFGIIPQGDIKKIIKGGMKDVPRHDILCGGFPCQPFSKAGHMAGMEDKQRGTLFDDIVSMLERFSPKYFILENVPFIAKHDNEETWQYMISELEDRLGYKVDHKIYSPHDFGIPQHRNRIFIVGSKSGLKNFKWPEPTHCGETSAVSILEKSPKISRHLGAQERAILELWQEFLNSIPAETPIPGFPIWAMEFGANYPFESPIPARMNARELGEYKGILGTSLRGLSKADQMAQLPSYARVDKTFPDWKQRYIRENREFYQSNKKHLKDFTENLKRYPSQSWQKFEWNVQGGERDLYKYIIQFRASGIRVKKPNFFPSLVCTSTQVPIIGWELRYITKKEGARLQSLEKLKFLPENDNACFKALGNAVNSKIVSLIALNLFGRAVESFQKPAKAKVRVAIAN